MEDDGPVSSSAGANSEDSRWRSAPIWTRATWTNPDDWKTGEEPETAAQRSYLQTLSQEAGEEPPRLVEAVGAVPDLQREALRERRRDTALTAESAW